MAAQELQARAYSINVVKSCEERHGGARAHLLEGNERLGLSLPTFCRHVYALVRHLVASKKRRGGGGGRRRRSRRSRRSRKEVNLYVSSRAERRTPRHQDLTPEIACSHLSVNWRARSGGISIRQRSASGRGGLRAYLRACVRWDYNTPRNASRYSREPAAAPPANPNNVVNGPWLHESAAPSPARGSAKTHSKIA